MTVAGRLIDWDGRLWSADDGGVTGVCLKVSKILCMLRVTVYVHDILRYTLASITVIIFPKKCKFVHIDKEFLYE